MRELKEEQKPVVEDIYTGYSPMTFVSGWNFSAESYPKDKPEDEQNQAISSYKRLGVLELPTPPSVTRADQEQALSLPRPSRPYRPMVNVVTYPFLFGENRTDMIERVGLRPPPRDFGRTNYMTTMQSSYVNYVEGPMSQSPPKSESYKPVTKHRRIRTDPFNIKRPNLGTFFDDNMDFMDSMRKPVSGPPPYGLDYQPSWTWDLPAKQ